jgi:hypothetical protein
VCVWCVCVLFVDPSQDDFRCLFGPHHHGGVQKAPVEVSLYKFHTTEESLSRLRSGRYYLVFTTLSRIRFFFLRFCGLFPP